MGFDELQVWPILALGVGIYVLNRTSFRVLRCGLANFCARVSGISFKLPIFSSFQSHTVHAEIENRQGISENENGGNNQRLLTKIEDFVEKCRFSLVFFACGFCF